MSSTISEFAVAKPTFWAGLGSWEIVVAVFENVFGGLFDNEFTGSTTVECTLDRSEKKMRGYEDDPVCLLNADEVGKSGVAALSESKADVDRIPTDGVGMFTSVALKVRESVVGMVEVRVRVNSTTDVDTWFWEIFTATAADMILVVQGEDIAGEVENRVLKTVKVEVTAAKFCPEFAAAWTPGDPSRAIVDPRIWKTVNDFITCKNGYLFFRLAEKLYKGLRGKERQWWRINDDR